MGSIEHFIEEFTYVGVFLVLFVAGLGVPIPEELPVLASGILAREGLVRWWLALPVCLIGVLTGDASIYWIGWHWGERVLEWRPVRYMLSREREEALKAAYRRHGVKIVFTARHLMRGAYPPRAQRPAVRNVRALPTAWRARTPRLSQRRSCYGARAIRCGESGRLSCVKTKASMISKIAPAPNQIHRF